MTVHEVILFKPTEALLNDPDATLAPAKKFFPTVDGCHGLYYGATEEDKDVALIVIVWTSLAHHQAVIDSPGYPGIVGLSGAFAAPPTLFHVSFSYPPSPSTSNPSDPSTPVPALTAPVTELLVQTLAAGKTLADLEGVLGKLTPKLGLEEGCVAGTWGVTVEDEKKSVLVLGWTSAKRHFEVVGQDNYKPFIEELFAVVDIKMYHTSFKKFA